MLYPIRRISVQEKRMVRKLCLFLAAALVAFSGAALAYAPYLPRLLYEGYPAFVWPSPGHYAEIGGIDPAGPLRRSPEVSRRPLNAPFAQLFQARGGKAFLVDRAGTLELEHYADGLDAQSRFNSFSMAKSLVGALVFKAWAEGRLESLDIPVGDILPDHGDASFRAVTVRQLLLMRGGVLFSRDDPLASDEPKDLEAVHFNPFGPMARLHALGFDAIESRLTAEPALGAQYRYQNVNTAILGAVLEGLYQRPLAEVLSEKLWRPAGADTAHWRRYSEDDAVSAYCCIFARPRDWIRIGRYLNRNGTPDAPFLPDALWREWMGQDIDPVSRRTGVYGYHIRHDVLDRPGEALQGPFAYMLGQGGQILYLLPQHDLVVLRFGDQMQLLHTTLYEAANMIGALGSEAGPSRSLAGAGD